MSNTVNSKQKSVIRGEKRTHHSSPFSLRSREARGFTLLMAVLVSGILLALGFAIFNIVSKELVLSSSGRESQFAFYAADSGVECALYWDYKENAFSTSTPIQPECSGAVVNDYEVTYDSGSDTYTTVFGFSLGENLAGPCVDVTVTRTQNPTRTTLISQGYNTCVTTNPRRIERTIRVQY